VATFGGFILDLPTLDDLDGLLRLVARTLGHILDLSHDFVALKDLTENNMAAIQPSISTGDISTLPV
jgi:hypothetical protein